MPGVGGGGRGVVKTSLPLYSIRGTCDSVALRKNKRIKHRTHNYLSCRNSAENKRCVHRVSMYVVAHPRRVASIQLAPRHGVCLLPIVHQLTSIIIFESSKREYVPSLLDSRTVRRAQISLPE